MNISRNSSIFSGVRGFHIRIDVAMHGILKTNPLRLLRDSQAVSISSTTDECMLL